MGIKIKQSRIFSFTSLLFVIAGLIPVAAAELAPLAADKFGVIEKVPAKPTAHWLWVYDPNFISFSDGRSHLVDGDTGKYLGSLNNGYVHIRMNLPSHYREIYSAETYYSRHVGGTRSDMVRIYDPIDLSLIDEIKIPNKRATPIPRMTIFGLSEDDRFMAVSNITPATSVSIVDLKERKFVGEIPTPGCTLAVPACGRRFLSLCSNGTATTFTLDDVGKLKDMNQSRAFFDIDVDPITENGVRYKELLLFPSVEGMLYSIDVSGAEIRINEPWSLVSSTDKADGWRTGGKQQIAVNEPHGRLYSIMHQGTVDTYEHAGPEVWVYDIEKKERIKRIKTERIATSIHVSPDDKPLLFSLPDNEATLDVYDALSGKHLRSIEQLGVSPMLMQTPPH